MIILLIFSALIALTYIFLMTALIAGLIKLKKHKTSTALPKSEGISIVIPFRNEAQHLPFLLNSLLKQNTSAGQTELIFVDDHSEDNGQDIIKNFFVTNPNFRARLISLSDIGLHGKKAAQKTGVDAASFDVIAFTDADCELPQGWISIMSTYLKKGVMMVCAPVIYNKNRGLPAFLYRTEFFSLVIAGAGLLVSESRYFATVQA
jgi:poly-beta-1,6-N-acetyl-D-glucosamine synthase